MEQLAGVNADRDGKLRVIGRGQIEEHINRPPGPQDFISMRVVFELEAKQLAKFTVAGYQVV
jgi:hypothetical protein